MRNAFFVLLLACRCLLFGAALLVSTSTAFASEELDAAWAAYEQGDFDTARAQAEVATMTGSLSPPEVIRQHELVASIAFALGETELGNQHASALAALGPNFQPGRSTPPEVLEAVEVARTNGARFVLRTSESTQGDEVLLRVQLTDPAGLSQRLRIHHRVGSNWQLTEGSVARIPVGAAYYVEALGMMGNVLARLGSREIPETTVMRAAPQEVAPSTSPAPSVVIAAGAGTAVVGIGLLLRGQRLGNDVENAEDGTPWVDVRSDANKAERQRRLGLSFGLLGLAVTAAGIGWRINDSDTTVEVNAAYVQVRGSF